MQPQGMIKAGDTQLGVAVLNVVGNQAGSQQVKVRGIREQVAVQCRVVWQRAGKAKPKALACWRAVVGVAGEMQKLNRVAGKAVVLGSTALD